MLLPGSDEVQSVYYHLCRCSCLYLFKIDIIILLMRNGGRGGGYLEDVNQRLDKTMEKIQRFNSSVVASDVFNS